MTVRIMHGDCMDVLPTLPAGSVNCCVTSPPYWGLRDYGIPGLIWAKPADGAHGDAEGAEKTCGHDWGDVVKRNRGGPQGKTGQRSTRDTSAQDAVASVPTGAFCRRCGAWRGVFGMEPTPELYVAHAVAVFREVRRVLRDDGSLWINLGDSYATGAGAVGECPGGGEQGKWWKGERSGYPGKHGYRVGPMTQPNRMPIAGLKPKDLCGIPWRVALALQEDGWFLRCDIIWHKPNPMPESVTDRPTKAHEYVFLLAKAERYYYDADAIAEPAIYGEPLRCGKMRESVNRLGFSGKTNALPGREAFRAITEVRNKRSVWTIPTRPFSGAHFAVFPPDLVRPCILAGCPMGGTVLDPFGGSGTVGLVAEEEGRNSILCELNPAYVAMARRRTAQGGLFCGGESGVGAAGGER